MTCIFWIEQHKLLLMSPVFYHTENYSAPPDVTSYTNNTSSSTTSDGIHVERTPGTPGTASHKQAPKYGNAELMETGDGEFRPAGSTSLSNASLNDALIFKAACFISISIIIGIPTNLWIRLVVALLFHFKQARQLNSQTLKMFGATPESKWKKKLTKVWHFSTNHSGIGQLKQSITVVLQVLKESKSIQWSTACGKEDSTLSVTEIQSLGRTFLLERTTQLTEHFKAQR